MILTKTLAVSRLLQNESPRFQARSLLFYGRFVMRTYEHITRAIRPNLLAVAFAGVALLARGSGLMTTNGTPARFITQDRGEPVPYLVDASSLPLGITTNQALSAVSNALAAWTSVTSLKFSFEGIQNFGMPSELVSTNDGKLRIQLYSYTNYISLHYVGNPLGIGGPRPQGTLLSGAGWGSGGNVAGTEFHKTPCGYVMLNHTNSAMTNLATFTEVLCHNVGHAIGLDDSTNNQSIMYPTAHQDGRGAQLGTSDPPVARQAYPQTNTPPYTYPRIMDITSASTSDLGIPGINEVQLRGYDLQSTNLSVAVTNPSAAGYFSLTGSLLRFYPDPFASGYYGRLDPAGTDYYYQIAARCSDGTNASAYVMIRVISLNGDAVAYPDYDGIPDDWMQAYFGDRDPTAGPNRGAYDDYDDDGMCNLDEYRAGMDPTDPKSCQRLTAVDADTIQWQAKPYELYELEYTTNPNPSQWKPAGIQVLPTTSTATATGLSKIPGAMKFFRVVKVP